jgi:hypothetical protein
MNRSKKIEDLIDLVSLLKGSGEDESLIVDECDVADELCEALDEHLTDYFWSCEGDSREHTLVADEVFDFWSLYDMVEYYNENRSGTLGE